MACFGWNTHPSAQGSSTLTPLSPQDSPLDPLRGVSSCEGPGGQTWKNTCKARARLRVNPRPPERDAHAGLRHLPSLCCSKTQLVEEGLGIPGTQGSTQGVCGHPGALQMGGCTADFSTLICKIRLQTTSQRFVKWKGFSSLNKQ